MNNPTKHPVHYHAPLSPVTPAKSSDFALASDDGATSILVNDRGEGHVLVQNFGHQEVFPFVLPSVPHTLRLFKESGKRKWLLDQLPLHPSISPRHPFRVFFNLRVYKCTFGKGVFAFAPAIHTRKHALRLLKDHPELVIVAVPGGLVFNDRFAQRLQAELRENAT